MASTTATSSGRRVRVAEVAHALRRDARPAAPRPAERDRDGNAEQRGQRAPPAARGRGLRTRQARAGRGRGAPAGAAGWTPGRRSAQLVGQLLADGRRPLERGAPAIAERADLDGDRSRLGGGGRGGSERAPHQRLERGRLGAALATQLVVGPEAILEPAAGASDCDGDHVRSARPGVVRQALDRHDRGLVVEQRLDRHDRRFGLGPRRRAAGGRGRCREASARRRPSSR